MDLILDNIIFSLQNTGGISVTWKEIMSRLLLDHDFNPRFIDLPNQNICRQDLMIPDNLILKNIISNYPLVIERYLNPKPKGKGIYHSSYYRIAVNPNYVNITTVHDFTHEYYRKGLPKFIHHFQKSRAIISSKRIICVSQNTKKDLLKFFPNFREEHINVIYNGVDDSYFPLLTKDEKRLEELVPFSSGEYVLYVGARKSAYKNFKIAVKACQLANLPLVIVGGGSLLKHEIQLLNEKLGKHNFITFLGINNNKLNLIYNHALCLLYPSLYEGFGIPIIEAQKAGCPVISTNYSSIPEVAGKGAILLNETNESDFADRMKQIKKNPAIVSDIKTEGYFNSQRFSWDQCYQQTINVYKNVYAEYF